MLMAYGHALAVSGDAAGARKALSQLEQLSRSRYVPALYFAAIYTGLGEKNAAMKWLEKAYGEHNDRLIYLGVEPLADPLRAEPRFRDLLHRVGLP
jgi:Flp pilus assembly protein TadD